MTLNKVHKKKTYYIDFFLIYFECKKQNIIHNKK